MPIKTNIKPYRKALEALIGHNTPAKISAMLANAAAELDDPNLRETLKKCIDRLDSEVASFPREAIRIANDYRFPGIEKTIEYIEDIIDDEESAWELIAASYGWEYKGEE